MKDWLLTQGKSFVDKSAKANDDHDEEDADETGNDGDTSEDLEDAKLQVFLRNMLDKNDLTQRDVARSISKSMDEEISSNVIWKLANGHSSFTGPKGRNDLLWVLR